MRTLVCVTVLLSLSAIAAPSRADDDDPKEVARTHYARGLELAGQGLYEGALEQFNAAYAKSPHVAVLYCPASSTTMCAGGPPMLSFDFWIDDLYLVNR